jgi:hypothetical protein
LTALPALSVQLYSIRDETTAAGYGFAAGLGAR